MHTPVLRRRPLSIVARAMLSVPFTLGAFSTAAFAQSTTPAQEQATPTDSQPANQGALSAVSVSAKATSTDKPATFGGGDIAKSTTVGVFGNQSLINLPFDVTSYTEKAVKDSQKTTVADFLQATDPNVRSVKTTGTLNQQLVIRGFELYSDDIALNGLYGLTPRSMVSTAAIAQVDVFKGSSAFIYGAPTGGSGVGGMVNVALKRADDKPLTEVTTSVSGSGQIGAHLDVGRRFGSDDQFGIRFNQSDDSGHTSIDGQKQYNKTTALALDWRGDKIRLTADFLYQRMKTDEGRASISTSGGVPSAPAATSNFAQPWMYSDFEDTVGILGAEYDFAPGWTAYVKGGLRHGNERSSIELPSYAGATGATSAYRFDTAHKQDASSAETGVHGKFDTGFVSHQFNASASISAIEDKNAYTYSDSYPTTLANAATVAYPATPAGNAGNDMGSPAKTAETVNKGVSVSDTLGFLNDRILLTIGARHQELRQDEYGYDGGTRTSSYDQSINTPIFGIVFKPLDNLSIYANRTEALVAGGVAPSYATNPNTAFSPFRAKQWEVGAKYDLGKFGANVALFQIEQPSANTNFSNGAYTYEQNGKQRNRGIEVGFNGEPIRGLRLNAGASYTQATLVNAASAADNGNEANGVPKWLANVGAEYDIPQVRGLTLTGAWIFSGSQFVNQDNTLDIGSWSRFDIGARYTTQVFRKDVTVRATIENVGNRAYWASAYGGYLTLGDPRTFWLSLTTDF